jgi:hypothetical protein
MYEDLRRTAGRSWMRVAEDRARWRDIGKAYVQQWTVIVMMMMMMMMMRSTADMTCGKLMTL